MTKKTTVFEKKGAIAHVISKLDGIPKHKKKVEKLRSYNDLDKAYKDSLRYGRDYIFLDDKEARDEFFKESYWLGRKLLREESSNENKESKMDDNKEIDVEFVNGIEKVDKKYEISQNVTSDNHNNCDLIKKIIDYGVTKLNLDFLVECNANFRVVGYIGDNLIGYLSDFDKIIELVKEDSYVESK